MKCDLFGHKSLSWGLLSIFLVFGLVGCAAQRAYRVYSSAQESYSQAKANKPNSLVLKEARLHLEAGRTYLDEARYDRAIESFEKSKVHSNAVISASIGEIDKKPKMEAEEEIAKMQEERKTPPPSRPEQKTQVQVYQGRGLPKQALAKYLALKKASGSSSSSSAAKKPAPKPKPEPKPEPEPEPEPEPKPKPKPAPAPKTESKKMAPKAETSMAKAPTKAAEKKVVVAPATRSVKAEPKSSMELTDEPEAVVVAPAPATTRETERNLRRIPGRVPFVSQDPSLQPEAMGTLNQVSKFLLENPSTTLVLKGKLADKEATNYVDARYESIKSYLTGKGVPEDQIRLDDERHRGKIAEFEMFVIEH